MLGEHNAIDGRRRRFNADPRYPTFLCTERGFIEFHHTAPYAAGGEATVDSIELRCRAHNLYGGELDFGLAVRRHAKAHEHRTLSDT